jgi:RimJ/RimL family protein N-acetyltransferase
MRAWLVLLICSLSIAIPLAWHAYRCEISFKNVGCIYNNFMFHWNAHKNVADTPLKQLPSTAEGRLVVLNKITPTTFHHVIQLFKNPHCSDFFFMEQNSTQVPVYDYIEFLYEEYFIQLFGKMVIYTVTDKKTNQISGLINLRDEIDENTQERKFILGGLATPAVWGKGLSQDTMMILAQLFFKHTTQDALTAETSPYNGRCATYLLKCGFEHSHITPTNSLAFKFTRNQFAHALSLAS